ncbi:MAG TPA: integrase family protein [Rhizomicrobium sp.]
MRLSDLSIKALKKPDEGYTIYPDAVLTGFGVRVTVAGAKSFVLTHGRLRKRETIGKVGILGLADARQEAKRRLAEYTLGKSQPRAITWNTAVDRYLGEVQKRQKPRTYNDYKRFLAKHFRLGALALVDVKPDDIQTRIDRLSATPVEQHHAFTVVRTFLRWAHRKHYLNNNPMDRMKSDHRYKPRARILTDAELKKVWDAAGDETFGHIVKLLILTGQRVGEVSKLSPAMKGTSAITLPAWLTKNGREHTFPVGITTLRLLTAVPFGTLPNFARHKAQLDKASGVSGWVLHDLRRTFASGLASLGVPIPVVEKLLNHVSGTFSGIVGVYHRYDYAKEMREAVELWEKHIQTLTA